MRRCQYGQLTFLEMFAMHEHPPCRCHILAQFLLIDNFPENFPLNASSAWGNSLNFQFMWKMSFKISDYGEIFLVIEQSGICWQTIQSMRHWRQAEDEESFTAAACQLKVFITPGWRFYLLKVTQLHNFSRPNRIEYCSFVILSGRDCEINAVQIPSHLCPLSARQPQWSSSQYWLFLSFSHLPLPSISSMIQFQWRWKLAH